MKYDVILLNNSKKPYSNLLITDDMSEKKKETTMRVDGISYKNTNQKSIFDEID